MLLHGENNGILPNENNSFQAVSSLKKQTVIQFTLVITLGIVTFCLFTEAWVLSSTFHRPSWGYFAKASEL